MSLIPDTKTGKVAFYKSRIALWTAASTTIGISSAEATAMGALITAAEAAIAAQGVAQNAAKTATTNCNVAVDNMDHKGADLIKKIRGTAVNAADPNAVYSAAQIPPPAVPGPVAAPGTPTGLKATLNPDGSITLTWKCPNPAGGLGTIYNLRRKFGTGGAFASLGGTGQRKFLDATIPAGTASAIYEITAQRSTRTGTPAEFVVNFGVSTAGEAFAMVASAPKLAA